MWGYTWLPFKFNVNHVQSFYDPHAAPYQWEFGRALCEQEAVVYNTGKVSVRPINEPRHYGQDWELHFWHDWHREYYLEALRAHVDIRDLYIDSSLCEGAHAAFVPEHPCPKCGRPLGGAEFLFDGRRPQINVINHGYSIPSDVGESFHHWAKSPLWKPPAMLWCGGDGGAQDRSAADGFKLKDDKGRVIWAQGDKRQTNRLLKKIYKTAKRNAHRAGYQITCFEIFQGYPWEEHFSVETIDWKRINGAVCAHRVVFGV